MGIPKLDPAGGQRGVKLSGASRSLAEAPGKDLDTLVQGLGRAARQRRGMPKFLQPGGRNPTEPMIGQQ